MQVRGVCVRLIAAAMVGLSLQACTPTFNEVILVNTAKENIKSARISVSGTETVVPPVAIGSTWRGKLPINQDSEIDVVIEFDSGKRLEKKVGYVTSDLVLTHELTVKDSEIVVRRTRSPKSD